MVNGHKITFKPKEMLSFTSRQSNIHFKYKRGTSYFAKVEKCTDLGFN